MPNKYLDARHWSHRLASFAILCAALALGRSVHAQALGPSLGAKPNRSDTTSSATGDSTQVSPSSPRASLQVFLTLTRDGRYADASRYLEPSATSSESGARLARELKLVLDRYVWFDLAAVSADAAGDTTDELAADVDQIAAIPAAAGGATVPVRLRRVPSSTSGDSTRIWRFSRGTVDQVATLYASLGNHWLIDRLPAPLLRSGPFELLWWQWMALVPFTIVVFVGGAIGGRVLRGLLGIAARRTTTEWDDVVLARVSAPLAACSTLAVAALLIPTLGLYAPASAGAYRLLRVGFGAVFFWALLRLVDVGRQLTSQSRWAAALPASRSLVPLGARVAK